MKLFCSSKLQKKLGRKLKKVPLPEDPLDRWYANLITLGLYDTIVAVLPDLRFCVILWNVEITPSTDLSALLVPAIRKALLEPLYGIVPAAVDRYLPADTVLEPCATGDQKAISNMAVVSREILGYDPSWVDCREGVEPVRTQRWVNKGYVQEADGERAQSWQAVKHLLHQRYGKAVPAFVLEVSLDMPPYALRRTLVVPAELSFDMLHYYLQVVFHQRREDEHKFILPPMRDRSTRLHVLGELVEKKWIPKDEPYVYGEDLLLADRLQEGDRFQYLCASFQYRPPWTMDIAVSQYIPSAEMDLPRCIFASGKTPPESERKEDTDLLSLPEFFFSRFEDEDSVALINRRIRLIT